ncbi:TetR/AcrR family transcriptional regulator [Nocardia stercoris]|uniref:TetR/AcrR family transcriptional regulator n=1 Tax=Nocardia stercoris TaxID=2483361 RepID=A0A3M2L2Y1_9NOCA|nr:TetR/AcrR family transcriptional regulator [Nocardia stercoris]RMI30215.1 TetR/AcrR family transcriptional regulator [Nocardia stercoris]
MAKRLTRSESQAQTRARLIESATELYLAGGYAATSNDQVAENAGYSRGAVYSNFAGKEQLALAVLDRYLDGEVAAVEAALGSGSIDDRLDALEQWMTAAAAERQWGLLKSELAVASRTSPPLRAALAERDRTLRTAVHTLIDNIIRDAGLSWLPVRPEVLTRLVLATAKGVAMDMTVDESSAEWLRELVQTLRVGAAMLPRSAPARND